MDQNLNIDDILQNIQKEETQTLIIEKIINQDQNYQQRLKEYFTTQTEESFEEFLKKIVIEYFLGIKVSNVCEKLKMSPETIMSKQFDISLLSENKQEILKDFMIFYHKYYIQQQQQFKEGLIGYNYRKIPKQKCYQLQFNKFFNSFYQIMDLEFMKKFQKFFACQICIGFSEKPALSYLTWSDQNYQNQVFCGCIMCEVCCRESIQESTCGFCNSTIQYQNKDNMRILSSSTINKYSKLQFQSLEQLKQQIDQQVLNEGQIPVDLGNKLSKYFQEYKDLKLEKGKDVFVATNLKEDFDIQEFIDFIEIQIFYYEAVKIFDEIFLLWKNNSDKLTEQLIQTYEKRFKQVVYDNLFKKLYQNRLLSTQEMQDLTNIALPNTDRESMIQYSQNNQKSFTFIKILFDRFRNSPKKDLCTTKLGIQALYDYLII